MLVQALPLDALASVGRVLTDEELAAACALTGFGDSGARSNTYHKGMKPNETWNPLHFIQQPEDETVQDGEDVSFEVEVGGGTKPYSYQWQIWDEKHQKWVDIPGFTGPTLSRKDIEKKWDGCKFRCVVTDASGTQIISQVVTLSVRDRVPTGDNSNLPLYLAVTLAALIALIAMRRRAKRG